MLRLGRWLFTSFSLRCLLFVAAFVLASLHVARDNNNNNGPEYANMCMHFLPIIYGLSLKSSFDLKNRSGQALDAFHTFICWLSSISVAPSAWICAQCLWYRCHCMCKTVKPQPKESTVDYIHLRFQYWAPDFSMQCMRITPLFVYLMCDNQCNVFRYL